MLKRNLPRLLFLCLALALKGPGFALAPSGRDPLVANVSLAQRTDGSKIVDVYYDLNAPDASLYTIYVHMSSDAGLSWGVRPSANNLSGDFGPGIEPGTGKHIVWQAGNETTAFDGAHYVARIFADDGAPLTILNPYANVDFATAGVMKADFHCHTTYSDAAATATPRARIDRHRLYGYQVLAIADHDTYGPQAGTTLTTRPFGTWPWSGVYADSLPLVPSPETAGGEIEYYPALEMFAVRGNELSGFTGDGPTSVFSPNFFTLHHVLALCAPMWNPGHVAQGYILPTDLRYGNAGTKLTDTAWQVAEIGIQGGLAIMAHPQKQWQSFCQGYLGDPPYPGMPGGVLPAYDEINYPHYPYTIDWYEDIYTANPHAIGIEAYGKMRDHRQYWDLILNRLMPSHPVWGFSNSDAHDIGPAVGKHMNMLFVDEASPDAIRGALEQGAFYIIHDPLGADLTRHTSTPPAYPTIQSVTVNSGVISVSATNYDAINWISDQTVIASGSSFDANAHRDLSYIRAEFSGTGGSIALTQPFGILIP